MKKEMLINVLQPEEIRIAIVEDGLLEELYVERTSRESYVGNIYKGRIVNIEPSIQAAFVDFGVGRNGFLHVSDVEPTYYRHLEEGRERGGRDRDRSDRDYGRGGGGGGRRGGGRRHEPEEDKRLPDIAPLDDDAVDMADELEHLEGRTGPLDEVVADTLVGDLTTLPDLPSLDDGFDEVEDVDTLNDEEPPSALTEQTEFVHELPVRPADEPVAEPEIVEEEDVAEVEGAAAEGDEKEGRVVEAGGAAAVVAAAGAGATAPAEEAPAAESTGDSPPSVEPVAEKPTDSPPPSVDDCPFPMSSAEHRTDDSRSPMSDEELSFSMAPPVREPRVEREAPAPVPPPPPPPAPAARDEPVETVPVPATLDFDDRLPPLRPSMPPADLSESTDLREPAALPDLSEDEQQFEPHEDRSFERDQEAEGFEPRPFRRDDRPRDDRRDDRRGRGGRNQGRGGRPGQGGRSGFGRPGGPGGGRPPFGRPKPLIQDIFKRGQEVLVQVIKEGIGTKGPTLSTYISIAGRYLVLMPGLNRIGVSRKIEDEDARRKLRDVMHELQPPRGLGFIMRTAAVDRNKKELQRDLAYLSRLWQVVVRRIVKSKGPSEIYQESDMITRTIRDIFTSEIDTIWVDEKTAFDHAQEFLQVVMPRYANRIKHYDDTEPMFHKYGIESEMDRIQRRRIDLPAGGSIVIDQTEALVAIDVNSGNFRADNNAEETAYQMNLQAAKEIARQLRLRDLGGVIVNDFIDMRDEKHRRGVERALRDAVQRDRARTKILRISQFGIIEMTRQRIRPSLKRSVFQDCTHCKGTGEVKTVESMSIEVMRLLQLAAHRDTLHRIDASVHEDVAFYLLNRKRAEIARLEEASGKQFFVQGKSGVAPEFLELLCYDNNNNEVKFMPYEEPVRNPRRR